MALLLVLTACTSGSKMVPPPPQDCVTLKESQEVTTVRCGVAIVQVMSTSVAREDALIESVVEGLLSAGRIEGDLEPMKTTDRRIGDILWTGRHFERVRQGKTLMSGEAFVHTADGQSRVLLCMVPPSVEDPGRCGKLVDYFGQYGASALAPPSRAEKQGLPVAFSQLAIPQGCRRPQGGTFDFVLRCSDGEFTWSRKDDETAAKRFLGTALELQRRWLHDGLTESEVSCFVTGVRSSCVVLRGTVERGPMTAVFTSAEVEKQWGIANCTYLGTSDVLPRACSEGIRMGESQ